MLLRQLATSLEHSIRVLNARLERLDQQLQQAGLGPNERSHTEMGESTFRRALRRAHIKRWMAPARAVAVHASRRAVTEVARELSSGTERPGRWSRVLGNVLRPHSHEE